MMKALLTTLLCAMTMYATAQTPDHVPFNGKITDLYGKPVKGVNVWTTDARRYAKSDKQGRFGLTDVRATDTLHLKHKKMTYDIPVEGRRSIRITIANEVESAHEDQELVDLGYGYVKHRECTISHNGISGDELRKSGKTTILAALAGRIAGLNISTGGAFGEAQSVNIRGINSIMLDTTPLYVVDGVIVDSLDYISIYDVDYVEVLKEGSIYGSRGANGVILVHTKK